MSQLAALNGEVVTIAVDPARSCVVACTAEGDAAVFEANEPRDDLAAVIRAMLASLRSKYPLDVRAGFVGGRLYLQVGGFGLKGGGSAALVAVDLAAGTAEEIHRDTDGFSLGRVAAPIGVDDRFVLIETYDGEATRIIAWEVPSHNRHDVLRLEIADEEVGVVYPLIFALGFAPTQRRLVLATVDAENSRGNCLIAVDLDPDCRPISPPEILLEERWEPYSPCVGGSCVDPISGEAACLMYASEHETFIPITRLPERGDPLPVADLHLARPGAAPRRVDVHGYLGTNMVFYDREADAPNLPHHYRVAFNFRDVATEVTPVAPLGPDRYLAGLFGGTLLDLRTARGTQAMVQQFTAQITALAPGLTPQTALVGLADGSLWAVDVPDEA